MKKSTAVCVVAVALGGAIAATPALASNNFYINFAHTPVYLTDSDNGDTYGNAIEFGVFLERHTRLGVYYEQMNVEDAADPNITGLAAERALLRQGNFTAASGVMIGNDGNNDMAADIYGRFTLAATDHTNMYARLAYRTLPQSTAADNLNGIALSIGFGINF